MQHPLSCCLLERIRAQFPGDHLEYSSAEVRAVALADLPGVFVTATWRRIGQYGILAFEQNKPLAQATFENGKISVMRFS